MGSITDTRPPRGAVIVVVVGLIATLAAAVLATDSVGGSQPVTPAGGTAQIRVDCDPGVENDLYLATQLVGNAGGGMAGPASSSNSFRVECGANVVDNDPSRPDRDNGQSGDAPRGRDNNKGRGNANGRR